MIVGYWPIKGRVHAIRYLLEYLDVNYKESNPSYKEWKQQKENLELDFPSIPYLLDNNNKLSQTQAILEYIVVRQNREDLLGSSFEEKIQHQQIQGVIHDIYERTSLVMLSKKKYQQKYDIFAQMTFIPYIDQLSEYLKDKEYFLEKLKYIDLYFVYVADLLDFVQERLKQEKIIEQYENLSNLRKRVKQQRGIKEFVETDQRENFVFLPDNIIADVFKKGEQLNKGQQMKKSRSKMKRGIAIIKKENPLLRVKKHIKEKYEEKFAFFVAREINQILQENRSKAEVWFKDYNIYDKIGEIMRRYYNKEESDVRLANYTAYYAELEDYLVPNYEKFKQRKIMFKRRKRFYQLKKRKHRDERISTANRMKNRSLIIKNKNVLKKLVNETVYLEQISCQGSLYHKPKNSWIEHEENFQLNLMDHDFYNEEHDIFSPHFSSEESSILKEEEKESSFLKTTNKQDEEQNIFQLDSKDTSLLTQYSEFDKIDHSLIDNPKIIDFDRSNSLLDFPELFLKDVNPPKLQQQLDPQDKQITKASFLKKNIIQFKPLTLGQQKKINSQKIISKFDTNKIIDELRKSYERNEQKRGLKIEKLKNPEEQKVIFQESQKLLKITSKNSFKKNINQSKKKLKKFKNSDILEKKLIKKKGKKTLSKKKLKLESFKRKKPFLERRSQKTNGVLTSKNQDNGSSQNSHKIQLLSLKNIKNDKLKHNLFFNFQNKTSKNEEQKQPTLSSYVQSLIQNKNKNQSDSSGKKLRSLNKESTGLSNYSKKQIILNKKRKLQKSNAKKSSSTMKKFTRAHSNKDKLNFERILPEKFYNKNPLQTPENKNYSPLIPQLKRKSNFLDEYNYYQTKESFKSGYNSKRPTQLMSSVDKKIKIEKKSLSNKSDKNDLYNSLPDFNYKSTKSQQQFKPLIK